MKRKRHILLVNAMLGPALFALTLIAFNSSDLRPLVAREDGGMHGFVAIILAVAAVYSAVFQIWLAKIFWGPRIGRAFDQIGRR
jgi:hypothetical protein